MPRSTSSWLYPLPPGVSEEAAAALALVGITAHLGLVRDARVRSGETLFVNGGSGGVGSTVVQMAKALGARVVTTAGSEEGLALCRRLGADLAIDYKREDVAAAGQRVCPAGGRTCGGKRCANRISIRRFRCWPSVAGWC